MVPLPNKREATQSYSVDAEERKPLLEALPSEKSFEQMLNESLYDSRDFTRSPLVMTENAGIAIGPNGEDFPLYLYPYAISRQQIEQVIQMLKLPLMLTKDIDSADVVVALRSHIKSHAKLRHMAKARQIPIHTIKANSIPQIARTLRRILNLDDPQMPDGGDGSLFLKGDSEDELEALEEARLAVEQIVIPKGQPVELLPRSASIRKIQHELVEHYHLHSQSFGEEPNRRLRIYPA
jgi:hypothetical protein